MKLVVTALIGAIATLAGAAPQTAGAQPSPVLGSGPHNSCFRTRDIQNHTIADDHTLYLNVAHHEVYQLTMSNACLAGAVSSDPLTLRVAPPGSDLVCKAIDLDLGISRGGFGHGAVPTPCIVRSITRLTPPQIAALPRKLRPY